MTLKETAELMEIVRWLREQGSPVRANRVMAATEKIERLERDLLAAKRADKEKPETSLFESIFGNYF